MQEVEVTCDEGLAQISTDGQTVWVNAPGCIGRFTWLMSEIFSIHKYDHNPSWDLWQEDMYATHCIAIPSSFKPR